jgi:hypothetical protein
LEFGGVHGDASSRDDVAQVRDRRCSERALGALEEELVALQLVEDRTKMA